MIENKQEINWPQTSVDMCSHILVNYLHLKFNPIEIIHKYDWSSLLKIVFLLIL